jgi:hypothetical protein
MGEKKQIRISVKDKIACLVDKEQFLVCGNNDYKVVFDFDSDWEGISAKTAVFVYGNTPIHQPFAGNVCEGVEIKNATLCAIGVFAGDIKTTTGATIECRPSIRDIGGVPKPPSKEVYDEIMALLDKAIEAHTELPTGGKKGQVLKKVSDEDYDTEWANDEQRDLSEIEESLANKLDKTSEAYKIYGTDGSKQILLDWGYNATGNTIVRRKLNGHIRLPLNPIEPDDSAPKGYVDGLVNSISEKQSAIEERVSDLESLTLSYPEIASTDYEKIIPAEVGKYALLKSIGGATEKVVSNNLLNPNTIVAFAEGSSYYPDIVHNTDGTITYTYANDEDYYDGGIAFNLADCGEVGRYHIYANDFRALGLASGITGSEDHKIKGTVWLGLNKAVEPTTLKVMVWKDTSATTTEYEVVTASSNTVFEPYYEPYFVNAEVEKVESLGKNRLPSDVYDVKNWVVTSEAPEWKKYYLDLADGWYCISLNLKAGYSGAIYFYLQISTDGGKTYTSANAVYRGDGYLMPGYLITDGGLVVPTAWFKVDKKAGIIYRFNAFNLIQTTLDYIYDIQIERVNLTQEPSSSWQPQSKAPATAYVPYRAEPIDTITIPEAVRSLDGYGIDGSSVEFADDKTSHIQRKNITTIPANVSWRVNKSFDNHISFAMAKTTLSPVMKATLGASLDCAEFEVKGWLSTLTEAEFVWYTASEIGICVNKSRLTQYGDLTNGTSQINAFKAWLSDNPVWIKYELAEPIVTDITDLFTESNAIQVQGGGVIRFVNENEMAVPNTVGFVTRKG